MPDDLTPTERCLYEALADSRPHNRWELCERCLADKQDLASLKSHISRLRTKLPEGVEIDCVYRFRWFGYRLVRVFRGD